jgi:hypothetical protein
MLLEKISYLCTKLCRTWFSRGVWLSDCGSCDVGCGSYHIHTAWKVKGSTEAVTADSAAIDTKPYTCADLTQVRGG